MTTPERATVDNALAIMERRLDDLRRKTEDVLCHDNTDDADIRRLIRAADASLDTIEKIADVISAIVDLINDKEA